MSRTDVIMITLRAS